MENVHELENRSLDQDIDLKAVVQTIFKRKFFILIFVGLLTVCGAIYAFIAEPIYIAKAIVEIGQYNTANSSNNTISTNFIELPATVVKRLEVDHVETRKKRDKIFLDRVSLIKGSLNLLEIVVVAPSNTQAVEKISQIEMEIKNRHQSQLDTYLILMRQKIDNLQLQKEELLHEKQILSNYISEHMKGLDKMIAANSAVAAIYTIALNNKSSELRELSNKIYAINTQINDLSIAISPTNIKSTKILGNISTDEDPFNPKKTLIICSSFVISTILAIFLVLLLEKLGIAKHE